MEEVWNHLTVQTEKLGEKGLGQGGGQEPGGPLRRWENLPEGQPYLQHSTNQAFLAKFPIWPSNHHGHLIIPSLQLAHSSPLLSPVTISQIVAANENVFSVNFPGKITDK